MPTHKPARTAAPPPAAVTCELCGQANHLAPPRPEEGYRCEQCNEALPDPFTRAGRLRLWTRAHWVLTWILMAVPVGLLLGGYATFSQATLDRLRSALADQRLEAATGHQDRLAALEQTQRAERQRLARRAMEFARVEREQLDAWLNDPEIVSGRRAREQREAEWARRLEHHPAVAVTPMEKVLMTATRLGHDRRLAARQALEQVILLVAPPGATNQITEIDGRFDIELAFAMSALSPQEQGARTRHDRIEDLRRETILMCAQLMRDLYDSCGWRGIRSLRIACNHATRTAAPQPPAGSQDPPTVEWQVLYRCSLSDAVAAQVASWRLLTLPQVVQLMSVETEAFDSIRIEADTAGTAPRRDPTGPLKF